MKPPEILGMVEEAAGTRMFEDKKEGAKTVIAKKQSKVDEINKLLSEGMWLSKDKEWSRDYTHLGHLT